MFFFNVSIVGCCYCRSFLDDFDNVEAIAASDASHILIVGKTMRDLAVPVPKEVRPIYVLTMLDENIQLYLDRASLPRELCRTVVRFQPMTQTEAASRLFYVSPLYETWRNDKLDPKLDDRFIMWDEFGLPEIWDRYTIENITAFLDQFDEGKRLAQRIRGEQ